MSATSVRVGDRVRRPDGSEGVVTEAHRLDPEGWLVAILLDSGPRVVGRETELELLDREEEEQQ